MKFLFIVAIEHENTTAGLAKALAEIGDSLPQQSLYASILQLLIRAHKWLESRKLASLKRIARSVVSPFELRYGDILESIKHHSGVIKDLGVSGSQVDIHSIKETVDKTCQNVDNLSAELASIKEMISLNSAALVNTNYRLTDLQFSQILRSISQDRAGDTTPDALSTIDILKYLAKQGLEATKGVQTEGSMALSCAQVHSATSEAEWFDILGSVLTAIRGQVYIIVDLDMLGRRLLGLQSDFSWLSAFNSLFTRMAAQRPGIRIKVMLLNYSSSLPFRLSSEEHCKFCIPARTEVTTVRYQKMTRYAGNTIPMANRIPESEQESPSQSQVPVGLHPLDEESRSLRHEAMIDIVIVQPPEKEPGLHSYGLPDPCRELYRRLETQKSLIKSTNANIGRMVRDPEVFRLSAGHKARVPEGHLGLAVLLSNSGVDIHFLPNDSSTDHRLRWEPGDALYFSGAALVAPDRQIYFSLIIFELEL
ncbi:Fc.00g070990.m01.CDS01 [Cosmosporella sp. VM-42]